MTRLSAALLVALLPGLTVYDAAVDFSLAGNPAHGAVWSYGWQQGPESDLRLYGQPINALYGGERVIGWSVTGGDPQNGNVCCPMILRNVSGHWIDAPGISIPPGKLCLHPGRNGEYSVVRWTCTAAGHYRLKVRFESLGRATTDMHIRINGVTLAEEEVGINGFAHDFSFESLLFRAGDHLDFAVGYGANRNYYGDMSGVSATVTGIPAS